MAAVRRDVAVVTGGGSGIGRVCCEKLALRGMAVVAFDLDADGARATVDGCSSSSSSSSSLKHAAVKGDATKEADIAEAIRVARSLGRFTMMIVSAGIVEPAFQFPFDASVSERCRLVLRVDLEALILANELACRAFREDGTEGSIVNISSMAGLLPQAGTPVYSAAKAGVIHFSRSLALTVGDQTPNIRVNVVCPTFTDTPLVRAMPQAIQEATKAQIGGKWVSAATVAAAIVDVATNRAKNGVVVRVHQRGVDEWPGQRSGGRAKL